MRIITLARHPWLYSCTAYLLLGDWNRMEDLNTVIDPGIDGHILEEIERLPTGCGKMPVEQVILTHNHFDHSGGVAALKARYGCRVLAFADGPVVDGIIHDGQLLRAADGWLEVIHAPGHSSDSICLYGAGAQVLFCGDTRLRVMGTGETYPPGYRDALARIAAREIRQVYSGHDEPLTGDIRRMLNETLAQVRGSSAAGFPEGAAEKITDRTGGAQC